MKYYICITELSPVEFTTLITSMNILHYNAILFCNDEEYGTGHVISPYTSPGTLYILHMTPDDSLVLSLHGIACIETAQIAYNNNAADFKSFYLDEETISKVRTIANAVLCEENWLITHLRRAEPNIT